MAAEDRKNDLRERTKTFALRVVRMYSALPKTVEAQILGKQVLRSGTSVGANSLRQECDELTAIFVSIIKSSRRNATS